MKKRLGLKVLAISAALIIVASGIVFGANPTNSENVQDETIVFDTEKGTYPSIFGEHKGNFTPKKDIEINKVYTYPCPGTGGHSEYVAFFYHQNETEIGNANWKGYREDWHNITFDEQIKLSGNETYKYLIKTGSYPQIIHKEIHNTTDGTITCTQFKDANGKIYYDWIPAIKLIGKEVGPEPTPTPMPQGFSPFAIAITEDGEYAYIGFDLSEVVFKVRLEDLTVEAVADLSEYFPIECEDIVLDVSEEKLFVSTLTWRKLIVIDTRTMSVVHTIDDIGGIFNQAITRSRYGPFLITWDGGNTVKFVNTETYEVTEFTDDGMSFMMIQESKYDQSQWYVVSGGPLGFSVGIYDYEVKAWNYSVPISLQDEGERIHDFKVLPNEQKAYVATLGGWYPEYHAYGWLYAIDLVGGEVKVVPIDGGAMCLEASPDSQWLYVGTGWPMPNDANNLLVVDTQSDDIVDQIYLGRNKYGNPYTQMNDLQIDLANPHLLYATCSDANAFIKVDLDTLTLTDVIVFNEASFRPHFFAKRPTQATGYILIHQSANAFELDLDKATIEDVIEFPSIRDDAWAYDVAIDDTRRLLIAQGETILEVDVEDRSLIATHPLPPDIPSVWHFVLSNDQSRIYAIQWGPEGYSDTFLAINTTNFQVEACFRLEGGVFNFRPYELPDGSKLYALGGMHNGPVVIQVIETDSYTVQKTITFDEPGLLGIAAVLNYPFAYDSSSHTLFVGATHVVLAIDTDTDVIKKVIYLGDVAEAIGLEPNQLTYLNAVGLVYHPQENYLYIAHLDRSFVSIYDLNNDQFLPQVIPLKGYFPNSAFANDDHSKIYTLNILSDSVSVIDVNSKAVEKVIALHTYL
jgi:YVTN family beta-propeller protein